MDDLTTPHTAAQRILVIGAYGLIGFGITKKLQAEGHYVSGPRRNERTARRVIPEIHWDIQDVSLLVVVNFSGALQDGPKDDLEALRHHAVSALANACNDANVKLIQVSAVGANLDAKPHFLTSKARGDASIKASGLAFHIFRPGLVLAPSAYGGTAMLRMLAAFPMIQPIALPNAQIQTVSLDDVADAIIAAVNGKIPIGFEGDLLEETTHDLRDVVVAVRRWLGFETARFEIILPTSLVTLTGKAADSLSTLGWRSPLRSTALAVLSDGVQGKPDNMSRFDLPKIKALPQTFAAMPARAEDRLFARMLLLMPLMIITLSLFWLASVVIGLLRINEAALTLKTSDGHMRWLLYPLVFGQSSIFISLLG